MRGRFELGSTPYEEPAVQVSARHEYRHAMQFECSNYAEQLYREFGDEASNKVHWNDHDFGAYAEVIATYDDLNPDAIQFVFDLERRLPARWDAVARKALARA